MNKLEKLKSMLLHRNITPESITLSLFNKYYFQVKVSLKDEDDVIVGIPICLHTDNAYFYIFPNDGNKINEMISRYKLIWFEVPNFLADTDIATSIRFQYSIVNKDYDYILFVKRFILNKYISDQLKESIMKDIRLYQELNKKILVKSAKKILYKKFYTLNQNDILVQSY